MILCLRLMNNYQHNYVLKGQTVVLLHSKMNAVLITVVQDAVYGVVSVLMFSQKKKHSNQIRVYCIMRVKIKFTTQRGIGAYDISNSTIEARLLLKPECYYCSRKGYMLTVKGPHLPTASVCLAKSISSCVGIAKGDLGTVTWLNCLWLCCLIGLDNVFT